MDERCHPQICGCRWGRDDAPTDLGVPTFLSTTTMLTSSYYGRYNAPTDPWVPFSKAVTQPFPTLLVANCALHTRSHCTHIAHRWSGYDTAWMRRNGARRCTQCGLCWRAQGDVGGSGVRAEQVLLFGRSSVRTCVVACPRAQGVTKCRRQPRSCEALIIAIPTHSVVHIRRARNGACR
jgi:ferredoxin